MRSHDSMGTVSRDFHFENWTEGKNTTRGCAGYCPAATVACGLCRCVEELFMSAQTIRRFLFLKSVSPMRTRSRLLKTIKVPCGLLTPTGLLFGGEMKRQKSLVSSE